MKHILSWKVSFQSFTIDRMLEFYQLCRTVKSNIYLFNDEMTCEVTRFTKLVSYILTLKNRELLIIVEGKDALSDRECIDRFFKSTKVRYPA